MKHFQMALRLDADFIDAHLGVCRAYLAQKEPNDANPFFFIAAGCVSADFCGSGSAVSCRGVAISEFMSKATTRLCQTTPISM